MILYRLGDFVPKSPSLGELELRSKRVKPSLFSGQVGGITTTSPLLGRWAWAKNRLSY